MMLRQSTLLRLSYSDLRPANGLKVNESKTCLTEFMTPETRQNKGTEKVEGRLLTDKAHCRMLGVNLQNNLMWGAHLTSGKDAILPGVRRQIGMLSRIYPYLSTKARIHLLSSLAISRMTYMLCLWGNTAPNHLRKAQVVLNSAGLARTTRQQELMEWLNM